MTIKLTFGNVLESGLIPVLSDPLQFGLPRNPQNNGRVGNGGLGVDGRIEQEKEL